MPGAASSLEAATMFAHENVIPAFEGVKCIDGRYELAQESGKIARPGAHFGLVLALLAVNRTLGYGLAPTDCFDQIYHIVTRDGDVFSLHTDQQADPDYLPAWGDEGPGHNRPIIGCRHIAAAADRQFSSLYGVDYSAVVHALAYARQRSAAGDRIDVVKLRGDHAEQGVLIVTGTRRTVNPTNGRSMYFVYDKTRDDAYVGKLVPQLGMKAVTIAMFKEALDRQTQATLRLVAAGKPMFTVNANGFEPIVSYLGDVRSPR
jgi:hypothetical protein